MLRGCDEKLPDIEVFPNKFSDYKISLLIPEYTAVCPKTGLPDFGTIQVVYIPDAMCIELKSFKYYIFAYRNLGITYENATNKIAQDIVLSCNPQWVHVLGDFTSRGGISTKIDVFHGEKPNHSYL